MDKKTLARWLIVPIAFVLVVVLLSQISLADITNALLSISPLYLLISFGLYILIYFSRAARFRIMLKNTAGYGTIFNIVCLHNLANSVMPFKTGELAFVYLTKVRMNVSTGIGVATVTIARMFDAIAVCVLFILALIMTRSSSDVLADAEPVVLALSALLVVLVVAVIWFGPRILGLVKGFFSIRILRKLSFLGYIQSKLEEVTRFYSSPESKRSVLPIFALSMLIWVLGALSMSVVALNMGLGVGPWAVIAGALVIVMFSALPIHGIGSLGTTELVWTGAFMALGATKEAAISSGFAVHLLMLLFTLVLGVYALVSDRFFAAREKKEEKSPGRGQ